MPKDSFPPIESTEGRFSENRCVEWTGDPGHRPSNKEKGERKGSIQINVIKVEKMVITRTQPELSPIFKERDCELVSNADKQAAHHGA
jgi:hypothetical protein